MGLTPKIVQFGIFWYKFSIRQFAIRGKSLNNFFTKFGIRKGVPRSLTPNFTLVALQMWVYCPKIVKVSNFSYKFVTKG